ncbi:MAG TPA: dihydrofolate reductase family protein [Mucilaginibacter sp.]|nr:dihydrofolate reductase family protein [Mucilaginibacter sp.]
MRRIIVSMNITIDGFMAEVDGGLDWQFNNWTADMAQSMGEQLSKADTILLGKNTYTAMAGYWPTMGNCLSQSRDDVAFAEMMNSYPKIVCSNTLTRLTWNNSRLICGKIDQQISLLKQQAGKDIIIYGSGKLVASLVKSGLIDEYRLWVYPVSIGKGKSLFKNRQSMKLLNIRQFPSGVVVLNYEACG